MEKIDTDWKTTKLKSLAKLFKPFNRDWAPLRNGRIDRAEVVNLHQAMRAFTDSFIVSNPGLIYTVSELHYSITYSVINSFLYEPVNSKTAHAPLPGQTPGHLTFLKNFGQIPRYVASLDGQMPHPLEL